MIIVRLKGGLGNQMFQYAFGYALAKKNNTELKFDVGSFAKDTLQRAYSLDIFGINCPTASEEEVAKVSKMERWRRWLGKRNVWQEPEMDWSYWEEATKAGPNAHMDGYWQCPRYFETYTKDIAGVFSSQKLPILEHSQSLYIEISSVPSVCVNVRRSDFLSNQVIGFVREGYYQDAYEHLADLMPDLRFFVFSDDMDWCRQHLGFLPNVYFVGHEHAGNRFGTYFKLMAQCRHFIIPNSSFAWWAAWLATDPGKVVVAPKTYLADRRYKIDVIPDTWLKI